MEMNKPATRWISVYQYSKKHGKSKQQIYLDIRTGKLSKEKWRKADITVNRLQILDE